MEAGDFLRIFMIFLGVLLLIKTILSLAKRQMTEQFCLVWAVLSLLVALCGILLKPTNIEQYISFRGFVLVTLIEIGLVWGAWFVSIQVSILIRKNQELAMQTSLLNQDSERLLREIEALKKQLEEQKNQDVQKEQQESEK